MWSRLALFCLRRALRAAESRMIPDTFDRPLSIELDRLRIALEALERVSIERGAP